MTKIKGSINVDKIDKEGLYQGEKGRWLSIILLPTPESEYGDYMIKQEVSYEEYQQGKRGAILGNAKMVIPRAGGSPPPPKDDPEDLPF